MDMESLWQQYFSNPLFTIFFIIQIAIFGRKKYLRIGGDDKKLLARLELSDIEGLDNEEDDSEIDDIGNICDEGAEEQPDDDVADYSEEDGENEHEEDAERQSEESSDSDPEMNIPLANLRARWRRTSWKKTDRY